MLKKTKTDEKPEIEKAEAEYRDYVLAELRSAQIRAKLLVNEIEAIGIALKGSFIHPNEAVVWLREVNGLAFLQPEFHELPSQELIPPVEAAASQCL